MAEQDTAVPAAAPVIFDPPLIYIHRDARVPPLPVYSQAQADALPPEWMSPDVWNAGGGGGGGGGSQTPWTSDIDAAGYALKNLSAIADDSTLTINATSLTMNNLSGGTVLCGGPVNCYGSAGFFSTLNAYVTVNVQGGPLKVISGDAQTEYLNVSPAGVTFPSIPQYANLAAAQAALGAGSGTVWRDMNNALFVA